MAPRARKTAKRCHRRWWPDLPDDLLSDVIHRLPDFGDRLRFRAVCRQWRRAERDVAQPPPPMPWLAAAGHCVGIHDAAIHHVGVALPENDACRGSFGNWLALVPLSPPPYQPYLLNPFTMARIPLPAWTGDDTVVKIILSSAPDSGSCTVAAVVGLDLTKDLRLGSIAVCRLRPPQQGAGGSCPAWWRITETFYLEDIAFFDGKLHAVDAAEQTYEFKDEELEQMREWPLFHRDHVAPLSAHNKYYLVPCHGRLLMVRRSFATSRVSGGGNHHTVGFKVSAVTEHSYGRTSPPPPVPIKSFDGHALFVGDACCGAFAVTGGEGIRIREGQICYADDESGKLRADQQLLVLQSYDLRTDCFRRYQPRRAAGPWQCVALQRLLHRDALLPPPATEWGVTLQLWEVMSSLGASQVPCYWRSGRTPSPPHPHAVDLFVQVYEQSWRFTKCGRSLQEVKQEAAREAVSFLRSRYRSVLDDSPWSSVPHYHSHVTEDRYHGVDDELEEDNNEDT